MGEGSVFLPAKEAPEFAEDTAIGSVSTSEIAIRPHQLLCHSTAPALQNNDRSAPKMA